MTKAPLIPFTTLNQTIRLLLTTATTQSTFAGMVASHFANVQEPGKDYEIFTEDFVKHITELHFHPDKLLVVMGDEDYAFAQFVTSQETFKQLLEGYTDCANPVRVEKEITVNLNPSQMKVARGFG